MRPGRRRYTIPLRLRSRFRGAPADRELAEAFGDYLKRETEEYVAQGSRLSSPKALASVACLFTLLALFAGYFPAPRAMKFDPMVALRYE